MNRLWIALLIVSAWAVAGTAGVVIPDPTGGPAQFADTAVYLTSVSGGAKWVSYSSATNTLTPHAASVTDLGASATPFKMLYVRGWAWDAGAQPALYDTTDTPNDGDVLTWNTGGSVDWQPGGGGSGQFADTATYLTSASGGVKWVSYSSATNSFTPHATGVTDLGGSALPFKVLYIRGWSWDAGTQSAIYDTLDTPTDGDVLTWNTGGSVDWQPDASGGVADTALFLVESAGQDTAFTIRVDTMIWVWGGSNDDSVFMYHHNIDTLEIAAGSDDVLGLLADYFGDPASTDATILAQDTVRNDAAGAAYLGTDNLPWRVVYMRDWEWDAGTQEAQYDTSDTPSDGDVLTWNTGGVVNWQPGGGSGQFADTAIYLTSASGGAKWVSYSSATDAFTAHAASVTDIGASATPFKVLYARAWVWDAGTQSAIYDTTDTPSDGDVLTWNTGGTVDWQPDATGGASDSATTLVTNSGEDTLAEWRGDTLFLVWGATDNDSVFFFHRTDTVEFGAASATKLGVVADYFGDISTEAAPAVFVVDTLRPDDGDAWLGHGNFPWKILYVRAWQWDAGTQSAIYDTTDTPSDGDVLTWNTGGTVDWQPDATGGASDSSTTLVTNSGEDTLVEYSLDTLFFSWGGTDNDSLWITHIDDGEIRMGSAQLWVIEPDSVGISGDRIGDFAGQYLSVTSGVLNAAPLFADTATYLTTVRGGAKWVSYSSATDAFTPHATAVTDLGASATFFRVLYVRSWAWDAGTQSAVYDSTDTPSDGDVLTWNTGGAVDWQPPGAASGTFADTSLFLVSSSDQDTAITIRIDTVIFVWGGTIDDSLFISNQADGWTRIHSGQGLIVALDTLTLGGEEIYYDVGDTRFEVTNDLYVIGAIQNSARVTAGDAVLTDTLASLNGTDPLVYLGDTLRTSTSSGADLGHANFPWKILYVRDWQWDAGTQTADYDTTDTPNDGDVLTWNTGGTVDWQPGGGSGTFADTATYLTSASGGSKWVSYSSATNAFVPHATSITDIGASATPFKVLYIRGWAWDAGTQNAIYDTTDTPSDGDVLTWNTGGTVDWQPDATGGASDSALALVTNSGEDTLAEWSSDTLFFVWGATDNDSVYLFHRTDTVEFNRGAATKLGVVADYFGDISTEAAPAIFLVDTVRPDDGGAAWLGHSNFPWQILYVRDWEWDAGSQTAAYDTTDTPSDGDVLTWNTGGTVDWQPPGAASGTFADTSLYVVSSADQDTVFTVRVDTMMFVWGGTIDDSLFISHQTDGWIRIHSNTQQVIAEIDTLTIGGDEIGELAGNFLTVIAGQLNVDTTGLYVTRALKADTATYLTTVAGGTEWVAYNASLNELTPYTTDAIAIGNGSRRYTSLYLSNLIQVESINTNDEVNNELQLIADTVRPDEASVATLGHANFPWRLVYMRGWAWDAGTQSASYDTTDTPSDGDVLTWNTGGSVDWQPAGAASVTFADTSLYVVSAADQDTGLTFRTDTMHIYWGGTIDDTVSVWSGADGNVYIGSNTQNFIVEADTVVTGGDRIGEFAGNFLTVTGGQLNMDTTGLYVTRALKADTATYLTATPGLAEWVSYNATLNQFLPNATGTISIGSNTVRFVDVWLTGHVYADSGVFARLHDGIVDSNDVDGSLAPKNLVDDRVHNIRIGAADNDATQWVEVQSDGDFVHGNFGAFGDATNYWGQGYVNNLYAGAGAAGNLYLPFGANPNPVSRRNLSADTNNLAFVMTDGTNDMWAAQHSKFASLTIDDPASLTDDSIIVLPIESTQWPGGITLLEIGVKARDDGNDTVYFQEWTDPESDVGTETWIDTLIVTTTEISSTSFAAGNSLMSAGNMIVCIVEADQPITIWWRYYVNTFN